MILILLYCFFSYMFMLGFLFDLGCETKLDKTYKRLCIIFAPIVLPFMIGVLLSDN
jgi:hypothetical protein